MKERKQPVQEPQGQGVAQASSSPQDAGRVLQDLLGLSSMIAQIKAVVSSPEVKQVFADAVWSGIQRALETSRGDMDAEAGASNAGLLKDVGVQIIQDAQVKQVLEEGIYNGARRLVTNAEVQRSVANVAKLIFTSQEANNAIDRAINTGIRNQQAYFQSPEFKNVLREVGRDLVASAQETINVSLTEAVDSLKQVELKGSFKLGG